MSRRGLHAPRCVRAAHPRRAAPIPHGPTRARTTAPPWAALPRGVRRAPPRRAAPSPHGLARARTTAPLRRGLPCPEVCALHIPATLHRAQEGRPTRGRHTTHAAWSRGPMPAWSRRTHMPMGSGDSRFPKARGASDPGRLVPSPEQPRAAERRGAWLPRARPSCGNDLRLRRARVSRDPAVILKCMRGSTEAGVMHRTSTSACPHVP